MSAPPSGFAPRPAARTHAARSRYCTLALAAALLPCTALPLRAVTKHPPTHKPASATHSTPVKAHAAPKSKTESAHTKTSGKKPSHASHAKAAAVAKPAATHLSPREALAAKAASFRNATPAAATKAPGTSEEALADRAMQERVHAWMRAHSAATGQASTSTAHATPQPDLSPTARKATVDDFDRAARVQTEALHAAAVQSQRTSTADDDAVAFAASQIPSTAPTARVPTTFTHGELLGSATSADFNAKAAEIAQQPATLTTKNPDAATLKKPDTRMDAVALASSSLAQPALSASANLMLPKPIVITRNTPAATAVATAAKHPVLDPQVTAGMSDETFDDDAPTPTAATAINLTSRASKTSLIAKPGLATGEFDTRSTGSIATVNLYDERGHLRIIPAMKGSHEILVHQNQMAVADGLDRVDDDDQLYNMRRLKLLVALPDNDAIAVNDSMPANRRFARPWSVRFLNDLARAHYARFHSPLVITSAVRTVAFQRHLVLTNGNAAPPTGEVASPHLYGQAIDLGKHGMSITEIAWMRAYLTPIEDQGKIDVEEEFQQACFHISVYRRYLGLPARKNTPRPDVTTSRTVQQAKATPAPTKHHRLPSALLATGLR
jgi:hypothetical protein